MVAGTSSSDLMPDETTSASVRASSPRSAETSMRSPRCTPPMPAGAEESDPCGTAGGERAADGRRTDSVLDDCGSDVARPDLARFGREPFELGVREPDPERAVENAHGRRHGAGVADGLRRLETRPRGPRRAGTRARRASSRARPRPPGGEALPRLPSRFRSCAQSSRKRPSGRCVGARRVLDPITEGSGP